MVSRREFLKTAASASTFAAAPVADAAMVMHKQEGTPDQIVGLFEHLPGDKAFKILAPVPGAGQSFKGSSIRTGCCS